MSEEFSSLNLKVLARLFVGTNDHFKTFFSYRELAFGEINVADIQQALPLLVERGLVVDDSVRMPGQRKADRMIMLTPAGFAFILAHAGEIYHELAAPEGTLETLVDFRRTFDELKFQFPDYDDFEPPTPEGLKIDHIGETFAVASDRIVSSKDNWDSSSELMTSLDASLDAISSSNVLSESERNRLRTYVSSGITLLKSGQKVAVGAIKFLIFDRLKEAYKSAMEDALKHVIYLAICALALWLAGAI